MFFFSPTFGRSDKNDFCRCLEVVLDEALGKMSKRQKKMNCERGMGIYVYICIYVNMCMRERERERERESICVCVYVHEYIYVYICIYTSYIYIYTYRYKARAQTQIRPPRTGCGRRAARRKERARNHLGPSYGPPRHLSCSSTSWHLRRQCRGPWSEWCLAGIC